MGIVFTTRKNGQELAAKARAIREAGIEPIFEAIDTSSYGQDGWNRLSPKFPHGNIPVPGWAGRTAMSVEGIWQGLKDMPNYGIDERMLDSKKPSKRRGRPLGHLWHDTGEHLDLVEARRKIYIPAYRWMIANCSEARSKYEELVELASKKTVYVYDFDSNDDVNVNKPYAHSALLRDMVNEVLAEVKANV